MALKSGDATMVDATFVYTELYDRSAHSSRGLFGYDDGAALSFEQLSMSHSSMKDTNGDIGIIINSSDTDNSSDISYSDISGYNVGIKLEGSSTEISISNSNLYNNRMYNIENAMAETVDARSNYWGTTIESEIGDSIFDIYDDLNYGEVIYDPFLTDPTEAGQL
jgi:nitrous oxidase accessory protein NosD